MTEIMMLFGLLSAIFWMYVGWQAMQAHQRLAAATEELARQAAGRPR
jgi:hypothetical protein